MSSPENIPLSVRNLTKRFRQGDHVIDALHGVSLDIQRGSFVAVMGPSGSGKSTLMHLMAGLTRADEGEILVDGQDISRLSDGKLTHFRREKIGLVFQSFNLIPTLTAEDNITLPLFASGRGTHVQKSLDEILHRLGIEARRKHRPDALSGGEQQRVAIARALITDPSIVLADEPTGSLDSATGRGICQILSELCTEQQRTIVVVTHEPAVAIWAKRVIVLKDGQLIDDFETGQFPDALSLATHYQNALDASEAAV
ncbi:ABC transporter ATP-binding protein [Blastopirellula marina]|uniref:Peptide ABC transporter ATP-binding protein n=1 Tax=Blastopirellula marina TaxID=124 RepID=A0A2S8G2F0_9BACT|nr:ABC transporter ATP-binding protein [Blastopirellula marina]PQO38480.1 peptide ABC transporter ATP-binding protein [Blastopirellula marina]PTL45137.1 ABC transporter ATP-binding protein [Blastopirellula marina]